MKILLLFISLLISYCLTGQPLVVTNVLDSGVGSLRSVLENSVSGDVIRFHPDLLSGGSQVILLNSTLKVSEKNITIIGLYNSEDTLFISGQGDTTIFNFENSESIILDSLMLIDGFTTQNGGGVNAKNIGYIQFNNGIIRNCSAKNGGAISHREDSIYNLEVDIDKVRLELNNSYFVGNSSEYCGGVINIGIYRSNYKPYELSNNYTIYPTYYRTNFSKTTFANNSSNYGGVFNASLLKSTGGYYPEPTFGYKLFLYQDINTCTFHNNVADYGADLYNSVGYSYVKGSKHEFLPFMGAINKTKITNSTFFTNNQNNNNSIYNVNYESSVGSTVYYESPVEVKGSVFYSPNPDVIKTGSGNIVKSLGYNIFSDSNLDTLHSTDISGVDNTSLNLSSLDFFGNSLQPTLIPNIPSIAINTGDPNDNSEAQTGQIYGVRDIGSGETCHSFSFQNEIEYNEFSWIDDNSYLTSDDSLTHIIENTNGCDSVIFLNLTIITPNLAYLKINPVKQGDDIEVFLGDNLFESLQFSLINNQGRVVVKQKYIPNVGENILRLPTKSISPGIYFIRSNKLDYNLKVVVN